MEFIALLWNLFCALEPEQEPQDHKEKRNLGKKIGLFKNSYTDIDTELIQNTAVTSIVTRSIYINIFKNAIIKYICNSWIFDK